MLQRLNLWVSIWLVLLMVTTCCLGQSCHSPNDTCTDAKYNNYDSFVAADAGAFLTRDFAQRRFPARSLHHPDLNLIRIKKSDLSGDWALICDDVGDGMVVAAPPPVIYTNPVSQPPSPSPSTDPVVYYNYPAAAIAAFLAGLFFLVVFIPVQTGIGKRSVSESSNGEAISSMVKDLIEKADVLWNKY